MKISTIISNVITLTYFNLESTYSFTLLIPPQINKYNKPLIRNVATTTTSTTTSSERYLLGGFLEDDSKIPKEYRAEIYAAEAKTPAAQGRSKRILTYSSTALVFFVLGVSNVILTTMKENGVDLSLQGYGWTNSIPFLSTSWGGFFDILAAGLLGTFVELENRTKEDVAEQIWDEFEKRKIDAQKPKKVEQRGLGKKKKKLSKSQKRFAAISEVSIEEDNQVNEKISESTTTVATTDEIKKEDPLPSEEDGTIFTKVKKFYNEADQMAASQALLLNKALEEKGMVDKITDESGLKVIGKDAVTQIQDEKRNNSNVEKQ